MGNLRPNFRYGLLHLVYKIGLIHHVLTRLADLNREVHVSNDQWADGTTTNQETIKSDEESEGDWESDVDDDRDSDLSDEGSDMGDEVWNMGEEDCVLSEEEYDMNDEILNAAGGVSGVGGLDDY